MTSDSRNGARTTKVLKSKCPLCGAQTLYSQTNPFRPFCSESCRNRDFSAWASDRYQVPGDKIDSEYPEEHEARVQEDSEDSENF